MAGGVTAIGAGRLFQRQLIGVTPVDPITFSTVTLLLMAVTLVAVYVPARRAARFDPAHALRQE